MVLTAALRRVADLRAAAGYFTSPRPHFLVILGMHRSGTSLVSRTLNALGADAGPLLAEQPKIVSDEVHWESSSLTWINEQMLTSAGGSWDRPPKVAAAGAALLWRARRFLWEFGGARVATFKDPRTCITYDNWSQILPEHSLVACIRHPLNVAKSLRARDGFSLESGLELWSEYNVRLLTHVTKSSRVYWFNFDEGPAALSRLAEDVSFDFALGSPDLARGIYSDDIHRHRIDGDVELPPHIAQTYAALLQRCRSANQQRLGARGSQVS